MGEMCGTSEGLPQGRISLSVQQTPWRPCLDAVLRSVGAQASEMWGGILLIQRTPDQGPAAARKGAGRKISFRFEGEALGNVLLAIAQFAELDLVMTSDVEGKIDFVADEEPALECLYRAVKTAGLEITEPRPDIYLVRAPRRSAGD